MKQNESTILRDRLNSMPNSVMFVIAMGISNTPISLETYERALAEGPEWFPDEIEFRRKWDLVPSWIKEAYNNDPGNTVYRLNFDEPDRPVWPGILNATQEDWQILNEYRNSETYKTKQALRAQVNADTWNKWFAPYGLTKTIKDFQ